MDRNISSRCTFLAKLKVATLYQCYQDNRRIQRNSTSSRYTALLFSIREAIEESSSNRLQSRSPFLDVPKLVYCGSYRHETHMRTTIPAQTLHQSFKPPHTTHQPQELVPKTKNKTWLFLILCMCLDLRHGSAHARKMLLVNARKYMGFCAHHAEPQCRPFGGSLKSIDVSDRERCYCFVTVSSVIVSLLVSLFCSCPVYMSSSPRIRLHALLSSLLFFLSVFSTVKSNLRSSWSASLLLLPITK